MIYIYWGEREKRSGCTSEQEAWSAKSLKQLMTHCWISSPRASNVFTVDSKSPGLAEQQISTLVSSFLLSTWNWNFTQKKSFMTVTSSVKIFQWEADAVWRLEDLWLPLGSSWRACHSVLCPWGAATSWIGSVPIWVHPAACGFSPAALSCSQSCLLIWMSCPSTPQQKERSATNVEQWSIAGA